MVTRTLRGGALVFGSLASLVVLGACGTSSPADHGPSVADASRDTSSVDDRGIPVDAGHPTDAGSPDEGAAADVGPRRDGGGLGDAGANLFAKCSLAGGCVADCSAPADDPIATGNPKLDLYDGCFLAGLAVAGFTEVWQGQLLKSQAYNESGITPVVTTNDSECGGQNCGPWAISAGKVSGDAPPGPCGSSATDPATGEVDYSHSYGLFQDTPACEGTFLMPALPKGDVCTGTTEVDNIPFGASVEFYCESRTSLGVKTPSGTKKGVINAVQDAKSPLYATSIFNPAYQLYVYLDYSWEINFKQANSKATGCTEVEQWYLSLAYWLTGDVTPTCTLKGPGLNYVKTAIKDYETVLYKTTWPYPGP